MQGLFCPKLVFFYNTQRTSPLFMRVLHGTVFALKDPYRRGIKMKTPPFVEVWNGLKKKRFYLFKNERLCYVDGAFVSCECDCKLHKGIAFYISNGAVDVRVENSKDEQLMLAGSKRRSVYTERPFFFDFIGNRFFLDNVCIHPEDFSCVGVWGEEVDTAMSYARNDRTVFIIGDTGTGKELMALNIHYNSKRRSEPFVVLSCASLDSKNAEAELFGSVRGAFTGSDIKTSGAFQIADGGTLVLDDIGSLPLQVQPMLLRALELNEIKPVGSDKSKKHNTRVIVTSNSAPKELLYKWKLRKDLYYRLEECCVYLPSLKGDVDRVQAMADFFAGDDLKVSKEAFSIMKDHVWPGNARELKNVIQRAGLFCHMEKGSNNIIKKEHIVLRDALKLVGTCALKDHTFIYTLQDEERELIRRSLCRNSWDISGCAKELKICRVTLLGKIKEYGLMRTN